jgi:ATP-dependent DNA helicase RecG
VEESEKADLQDAIQAAERLQATEFQRYRVGLVYGRMKAQEEETMAAFVAGALHALVATTVIEGGGDVPNATVMLIEHADRFGLAQLHQLRGRVGRGAEQAHCLLLASGHVKSGPANTVSRQRLMALVQSTDGFVIADEDLRIRGPGEYLGVRQWGVPDFRVANLLRDRDTLEHAREEAFRILDLDPNLEDPLLRPLKEAMMRRWRTKLDLASVG